MSYVAARTEGAQGGPLFLTFHGTGGDETQFHALASELNPNATIISPRGNVLENGMNRFFRRAAEGVYDMDDLWERSEAMASFIADQIATTQPSRVVALGYSNGANILAAVSMIRPELIDDLILMHPLIPWTPDPQPGLAGRRILITAGRHDPICPEHLTKAFAEYLENQGTDLRLHWHQGGHEIHRDELASIQSFLAARPA